MKTHYIYEHNAEVIDHNKDIAALEKDIANQFYPEDAPSQCIELDIYESNDSIYIEGEKVDLIEESDLFSILLSHNYNLENVEYIETEFIGNCKHRAIFHKLIIN